MTQTRAFTHTEHLRDLYNASLAEDLTAAAAAAANGDWKRAAVLADRLRAGGEQVHHSVVRDALIAGLDWFTLGELLAMHSQAAFDTYANLVEGAIPPARQRPELAVVCTAGLAAVHDMRPEYGIDLNDLDSQHSLTLDPTVIRLRAAAKLLCDDIWISVTLPGEYDGDDDLVADEAIVRWTTLVLRPEDLTWLREALSLNAVDDALDEEDLEPLD